MSYSKEFTLESGAKLVASMEWFSDGEKFSFDCRLSSEAWLVDCDSLEGKDCDQDDVLSAVRYMNEEGAKIIITGQEASMISKWVSNTAKDYFEPKDAYEAYYGS